MIAKFKDNTYISKPGVPAAGNIIIRETSPEKCQKIVNDFIEKNWRTISREPLNQLKYPYLVPGATYNDLWDWDAWFTSCALPDEALPYMHGSAENLIASPLRDGRPSKKASESGEYDYYLHPYPLRAQFAVSVSRRNDCWEWLEPYWETLQTIMAWYETAACDSDGFFRWLTLSGIDNDPAVYGRTYGTIAGVDLACFHYREYTAMGIIARKLGKVDEYSAKAEALKTFIQQRYYDEKDKFFYAVDRNIDYKVPGRQLITWDVRLKFKNWTGLYPLWTKCATPEQAAALREKVMDENEFLSPAGVRSHSKDDRKIYNNAISGGPSNWQGPVWGLSTALVVYGLMNYGFSDEAREVASRMLRTFAADITQNGTLHEYYHGDNGQPLIKPGFLNWNSLFYNILNNVADGVNPFTFDDLQ